MVNQRLSSGDYAEAIRFGQEALSIARTLGDRSLEIIPALPLGMTYIARGELNEAGHLPRAEYHVRGRLAL